MPIEKGVPLSPMRSETKYPFAKMVVGDSFLSDTRKVQAAASTHAKRHGGKFAVRKEAGGFRCWRVA